MAIKSVGLIDPVKQYVDASGVPYASGTLGFYVPSTLTLLDVYSDPALTTPLTNPVPLNAAGRTSTSAVGNPTGVYCQQTSYDYILKDANGLTIEGPITFSGSQWPGQVQGQASLSPAANANGYTNRFTTTINKASTGTHALFAGTRFDIPTIGAGGSTLTESATVYIEGAPATGTNPYALDVASGTTHFGGPVQFSSSINFNISQVNFRLTFTTGTPVTTADVTGAAAGTLFLTPYRGNIITLYNGSAWTIDTSAEVSIAVPATLSQMFDVFCFDNGGTPTLELLAWTNDTARATALTTQDGVLVKTGAPTRRYMGSMRTTGIANQSADSFANRYLWNYYNRVSRANRNAIETTDSWAYSTKTWRQANANTANQLDQVIGVAEVEWAITANHFNTSTAAGVATSYCGIGIDSTTAIATGCLPGLLHVDGTATCSASAIATLKTYPAVGRHTAVWLEAGDGVNVNTWLGDGGTPLFIQTGITGEIDG